MVHDVDFTRRSLDELKGMGREVTDKLFRNFVKPIRDGYIPPKELRGKYKPSWEMRFIDSPMKQAFMDKAVEYNFHHYHFGYKFYDEGKDSIYAGDVSDGIIHTRIETRNERTLHVIAQVCLEHPSPFKYPFDRALDKPIGYFAA